MHGAYWLVQYESDIDELSETILAEDVNGTTISSLERLPLVLGKRACLKQIADENEWDFKRSKASIYAGKCNGAVHLRVAEYTNQRVKIGDSSYSVESLVYGNANKDPEELLDEVVKDLLESDSSTNRRRLGEMG